MNKFMKIAIEEANLGINNHHGGPFGAVIVKDNNIIARSHNKVLINDDPTCHGEISAIREACDKLNTHDLSGCVIYTTGEPCHMCLCACMWANIDKIYYGCTIKDNELIGFRDDKFNKIFGGREKLGSYIECIDRVECLKLFDKYKEMNNEFY
ncbi:MAG: nucleoside deaminase [bacterium]|nr:nucleoside deaminase [bacterium]